MTDEELYRLAEQAAGGAYAPYSGYRVGAALLTASGKVYTGANVENASYGATICAERTAAVKAVTDGELEFVTIAIAAPESGGAAWPCGICRQFLCEFSRGLRVVTGVCAESLESAGMDEILPNAFRLEQRQSS